MVADKTAFIDFLLSQEVLQFGEFTLNSGRVSPYFFNLGAVNDGLGYAVLGEAYAATIIHSEIEFEVLFGPAYKGIPIAVATAMALARHGRSVGVAYNRKEPKDHGEGGLLVGAELRGRVLLIDDVLTSGKAIRAAAELIDGTGAEIVGAVIAMDREEFLAPPPDGRREGDNATAVSLLSEDIGASVMSIANLHDLIEYLEKTDLDDIKASLSVMREYQSRYCRV